MERAGKSQWERQPGIAADGAAIGHLRTGQQSDQRRLAGAVDTKNAGIVSGRENGARVAEHDLAAGRGRIGFGDALELDHSSALSRRRSPRSSANPAKGARIART